MFLSGNLSSAIALFIGMTLVVAIIQLQSTGNNFLSLRQTPVDIIQTGNSCYDKDKRHTQHFLGCVICNNRDRYAPRNLQDMTNESIQHSNTLSNTHLFPKNNSVIFSSIYSSKIWSDAGGGSGEGSDSNFAAVAGYVLQLVTLKYQVVKLLDAPCGAASSSWTQRALISIKDLIPCFQYHGVDVVEAVIRNNTRVFSSMNLSSWTTFSELDLSSPEASLPYGFDMILSRDALQHLSMKHIAGAMRTYCSSDAKFLLVGSYLDELDDNRDIASGGCFKINLRLPPFSFPAPLESFQESVRRKTTIGSPNLPTKHLLLYELPILCESIEVRNFIATHMHT